MICDKVLLQNVPLESLDQTVKKTVVSVKKVLDVIMWREPVLMDVNQVFKEHGVKVRRFCY